MVEKLNEKTYRRRKRKIFNILVNRPHYYTELKFYSHIDPSRLRQLLDKMREDGFLEEKLGEKKRKYFYLTEKGKKEAKHDGD